MEDFLMRTVRDLVPSIIAVAGAIWAARGAFADQDRRISVLEAQLEAQIGATKFQLDQIRLDLRELRTAILDERGRK